MADFLRAVNFVLGNEGGFSNDPADAGGPTKYGVSLAYLKALPPERVRYYGFPVEPELPDVERMTLEQATTLYMGEFWSLSFSSIPQQSLCNYVFDMAVNHGPSTGIKMLQRGLCAVMTSKDFLVDDGIMGPKTLTSLSHGAVTLPAVLIAQRAQFYRQLVAMKPVNKRFLDGWLKRAFRYG